MSSHAIISCDHCDEIAEFEGPAADIENHFIKDLEANGWYIGFVLTWCPACKAVTPNKDRVILDRDEIQRTQRDSTWPMVRAPR